MQTYKIWEGTISVLFSEPKISQMSKPGGWLTRDGISVLFSEPKISQTKWVRKPSRLSHPFQCSSASRKFLKRSFLAHIHPLTGISVLFSEPKISQILQQPERVVFRRDFSALQRAENFSNCRCREASPGRGAFQCSSASRKFLKRTHRQRTRAG